jgi:plasmid stabilization system protein ParE
VRAPDKLYKLITEPEAITMLYEHADFLAQVSLKAAERLIDQFYKLSDSLKTMPEIHPWLVNPDVPEHKYRKLSFEKRYLILYQIDGDTVHVDAVVDGRMQYARFLDAE